MTIFSVPVESLASLSISETDIHYDSIEMSKEGMLANHHALYHIGHEFGKTTLDSAIIINCTCVVFLFLTFSLENGLLAVYE